MLRVLWFAVRISLSSERRGLSPGSVPGGRADDHLLLHGPAVVRGGHRHLHRPHRLAENGDPDVGARGDAQILGRQVSDQNVQTPYFLLREAEDGEYQKNAPRAGKWGVVGTFSPLLFFF